MKIQRKTKKRIAALLSGVLVLGMIAGAISTLPVKTLQVQAAIGSNEPSVTAFATKAQLMDDTFAPNEDGTANNIGKLTFGNNSEGNAQEWYILGKDNGVSGDNTVIFAASPIAKDVVFNNDGLDKTYQDGNGTYADGNPTEIYANHYGASNLRNILQNMASEGNNAYFSAAEKALMQETTITTTDTKNNSEYTTSDKLYAVAGDFGYSYVKAGSNDSKKMSVEVYCNNAETFFLRTPSYNEDQREWVSAVYLYINTSVPRTTVDCMWAARPASNLNMSSVLFASAIEKPSDTGRKQGYYIPKGTAMTLRLDGSSKDLGSITFDAAAGNVVGIQGSYTGVVKMIIQGKDGDADWYFESPAISDAYTSTYTATYIKEQLSLRYDIDLSACKIWLETIDDDGMIYAVMATDVNPDAGKTETEISSVEITDIDIPVAGTALDVSAVCETAGVSNTAPDVTWIPDDVTAGYNTSYTASVTLTPDTGYKFADSVTATVNGNNADVTNNEDGTITVTYAFAATESEPAAEHIHYLCAGKDENGNDKCNGEGNGETDLVTFKAWTESTSLPDVAGNWYLTQPVTLTESWEPVDGTVLCLNGQSITMNSTSAAVVISIQQNRTFTLCDCKDRGIITHGINSNNEKYKGRGVFLHANTTFNMYGGKITGNTPGASTGTGAGIGSYNNEHSAFNMYGGEISGNNVNETAIGGGALVRIDSTFVISGNARIYDNWSGGTLNTVTGSYEQGTGHASNVYVSTGESITIGDNGLTDSAKIGVTTQDTLGDEKILFATNANDNDIDYNTIFTSDVDSTEYKVIREGSNLFLGKDSTVVPVTYTITATAGANGSITPSGDVEVEEGNSQSFTITADEGYEIEALKVDGNEVGIAEIIADSYTFEDVTSAHTIEVTFKEKPAPVPPVEAPVIITQPKDVTVNEGESASFEVTATGTDLKYQWQVDKNDGSGFTDISGADNSNYTINTTEKDYSGYKYRCVVSNTAGIVTSDSATLTVIELIIPPTIYTITATAGANGSITPSGDVEVEEGNSQSFTITADEGYEIETLKVDGKEVSVAEIVADSYTFENVTSAHTIEVTFKEKPAQVPPVEAPVIITQPKDVTVNEGEKASFEVTATGTDLKYQWQVDKNDGKGFTDISGADNSNYTINTTDKDYSGYKYRCVVSNTAGTVTSESATLTVIELIIPPTTYIITATAGANGNITPSGDVEVEEGNSQSFTITADEGYEIETLTVDGKEVSVAGSYTFENVTSAHIIEVTFKEKPAPTPAPDPVPDPTPNPTPTPDPTPVQYKIIEGADSTWTQNTDVNLVIKGNGDFAKFESVKVDGTVIDAKNYTAAEGSTVITLKADYLKTLSVGSHTFEIVWTDGSAGTNFTVVKNTVADIDDDDDDSIDERNDDNIVQIPDNGGDNSAPTSENTESNADAGNNSQNAPLTGDTANIMLWITFLMASAACVAEMLIRRKENECK